MSEEIRVSNWSDACRRLGLPRLRKAAEMFTMQTAVAAILAFLIAAIVVARVQALCVSGWWC